MEKADKKENLKEKSVLVYDYGIFTELAASLTKYFGRVYYYVPWQDAFPSSGKQKIGMDFKGLTRVQNFWDYVNEVDLIVSFDTYCGDLVDFLRGLGYRVWGAGAAERLELKRWEMRQNQFFSGMNTQPSLLLKSIDDLELYLQGAEERTKDMFGQTDDEVANKLVDAVFEKYDGFNEDYFVGGKISKLRQEFLTGAKDKFVKSNMRGDIETFAAPNYNDSQSKLNSLFEKLGHRGDAQEVEFVIEDQLEGIEPGFDGIQINGKYLSPTLWGFEKKGKGYIGRVTDYKDLPQFLKEVNAQMQPMFERNSPTASFFSTEVIVDKAGRPFLIDPCVRNPAPIGSAIYSELYLNLGEILYYGAEGKVVEPKLYPANFVAGVSFSSDWANEHELEVEVDPEISRWVKFRMAYSRNDKFYAVPGMDSILSVIGFGDTMEEAVKLVEERMKGVSGYGLGAESKLRQIMAEIEEIEEEKPKNFLEKMTRA